MPVLYLSSHWCGTGISDEKLSELGKRPQPIVSATTCTLHGKHRPLHAAHMTSLVVQVSSVLAFVEHLRSSYVLTLTMGTNLFTRSVFFFSSCQPRRQRKVSVVAYNLYKYWTINIARALHTTRSRVWSHSARTDTIPATTKYSSCICRRCRQVQHRNLEVDP